MPLPSTIFHTWTKEAVNYNADMGLRVRQAQVTYQAKLKLASPHTSES